MQTQVIILLATAMVIVMAFKQGPVRTKPQWLQHLKGSQKLLGVVAFIGGLLIVINPEFFALGLLGDTAFFEMLVLALTLQMHLLVVRTWQRCVGWVTRGAQCMGIPSPGLCYVLALSVCFVSVVASSLQKVFHRFFPSA